jgi:hypothetical protein
MAEVTLETAGGMEGRVGVETRRCEHIKESGHQCRNVPSLGERVCYSHRRFTETGTGLGIQVPLLEDEASIRSVLSQTARALARAEIPPANGMAIIRACNIAAGLLQNRLARAKFAAQERRRAAGAPAAGPIATPAMAEPHESAGAPVEDAEVELVPLLAAEGEGVPEQAPVAAEPETGGGFGGLRVRPRFREVREQWDKSLARTEGQMTDALTMTAEEREQRRAKREAEDEAGLRVDPLDVYFGRVGVGNAAVGM